MLQSINHKQGPDKPRKPRTDFPLFPHASGRWAKKVRGRFHYFGKVAEDPRGATALQRWLDQRDDLLAGRVPRTSGDGLTIRDLANRFLTVKQHQVETQEITQRHFDALYKICDILARNFGKTRRIDDLAAADFESLRVSLAKTRKAWALSGTIAKIRSVFNYGFEAGLLDRPVRYGPNFKRPTKAAMRREKGSKPPKLFSADELRKVIHAADGQLKAMILLGINCGLGNADCGQLARHHLDMQNAWLRFPRPKTGVDRRSPLWPETLDALRLAIKARREPKNHSDCDLVFITKYGRSWYQDKDGASALGYEFRKLLGNCDVKREGLTFYALRHTFATMAGASSDQVAINLIMGHADNSMSAHYREWVDDQRLTAITDLVHRWLWESGEGTNG